MSCRTSGGCLLCNDRSEAQTGVGQGPHEFRRAGRIAGAIRESTLGGHIFRKNRIEKAVPSVSG